MGGIYSIYKPWVWVWGGDDAYKLRLHLNDNNRSGDDTLRLTGQFKKKKLTKRDILYNG